MNTEYLIYIYRRALERIILKDQFFLSRQLHYSTHAKTNQARSNEFKAYFQTILIIDGI